MAQAMRSEQQTKRTKIQSQHIDNLFRSKSYHAQRMQHASAHMWSTMCVYGVECFLRSNISFPFVLSNLLDMNFASNSKIQLRCASAHPILFI